MYVSIKTHVNCLWKALHQSAGAVVHCYRGSLPLSLLTPLGATLSTTDGMHMGPAAADEESRLCFHSSPTMLR